MKLNATEGCRQSSNLRDVDHLSKKIMSDRIPEKLPTNPSFSSSNNSTSISLPIETWIQMQSMLNTMQSIATTIPNLPIPTVAPKSTPTPATIPIPKISLPNLPIPSLAPKSTPTPAITKKQKKEKFYISKDFPIFFSYYISFS